jgi:hypothetical protein
MPKKKKINKQNIIKCRDGNRYLKFDSTWFLGINFFLLQGEKGGGGIGLGYFFEKKSMFVKKRFFFPQRSRIRF